jgi:flavin reductase (DIM6/NTAB) family NADH-FMN oxidoreductase RutF
MNVTRISGDPTDSLRELVAGFYLITAAHDGRDSVQRSWRVMALSEGPTPRVGVALLTHYAIADLARSSGQLAINVAGPRHIPLPRPPRTERPAVADEFAAIGAIKMPARVVGAPLVEGCAAYLECAVEQEVVVEDRSLFVCRVVAFERDEAIIPVVRVRGRDLDLGHG